METLKFTPPVMDYVAVLPQVILVATALIILVIGVFKEWAKAAVYRSRVPFGVSPCPR